MLDPDLLGKFTSSGSFNPHPIKGELLRPIRAAIALRFAALDSGPLPIPIADPGFAGVGSVMLGHGFGFPGQRGFGRHFGG